MNIKWIDGFVISVNYDDGIVTISANKEGLFSLADQLVSLAVQKANYAVKMYEKVGFETVDENEKEYIMVCRL